MELFNPSLTIAAFYGYKGGAGRSMLAANVAYTLSVSRSQSESIKTLLVDWDLEAPGIGDFLDVVGLTTKEGRLAEAWQRTPGIFDLLVKCDEQRDNLGESIRAFLKDNAIPVLRPNSATTESEVSLGLLGPAKLVGRDYAGELVSANWLRIFGQFAEEFASAFKAVCSELGYKLVIIDTRTGLNTSTFYVMRWLANKVFLVSPKTHQALEGSYRAYNLLRQMDEGPEAPECALILTRHERADAVNNADRYINEAFGDKIIRFDFPHEKAIRSREQLIFENTDSELLSKDFEDEFARLCEAVGRTAVDRSHFNYLRKALNEVGKNTPAAEALEKQLTALPQLLGEFIVWRENKGLEAETSKPNNSGQRIVSKNIEDLLEYYKTARAFDRSTINVALSKSLVWLSQNSTERGNKAIWRDFEQFVGPDLWRMSLLDENAEADDSLLEGQTESTPKRLAPDLESLTRTWREGVSHLEADNPEDALMKLNEGIRQAKTFQSKSDEQRVEVSRLLTIFANWKLTVLYNMSRFSEAAECFRAILEPAALSFGQGEDGLSRADFENLLLFFAQSHFNGARDNYFFSREDVDRAIRNLQQPGVRKDPEKELEDKCQIAEYRLWNNEAQQLSDRKAALKSVAESYEAYMRWIESNGSSKIRSKTRVLAESARACALLAQIGEADPLSFRAKLTEGRNEVDKWFNPSAGNREEAPSGDDILALAYIHLDCGDLLEAFDLYLDAIQVMRTTPDRFVRSLANATASVGLIEARLGRPDLAKRTWESWSKSLSGGVPEFSARESLKKKLELWNDVTDLEIGADENLLQSLEQKLQKLDAKGQQDPDVGPQKQTVRFRLPFAALANGDYQAAIDFSAQWRNSVQSIDNLDLELPRLNGSQDLLCATACYCLERTEKALHFASSGLRRLQKSAELFGSRNRLVYLELKLIEAEIKAFGRGELKWESAETVSSLETFGGTLLGDQTPPDIRERFRGWFYTDLIRVATAIATAAAIALYVGETGEALQLAESVEKRWLSSLPELCELGLNPQSAALPRWLAWAVLSKMGLKTASEVPFDPRPSDRKRYQRIFDFCQVTAGALS